MEIPATVVVVATACFFYAMDAKTLTFARAVIASSTPFDSVILFTYANGNAKSRPFCAALRRPRRRSWRPLPPHSHYSLSAAGRLFNPPSSRHGGSGSPTRDRLTRRCLLFFFFFFIRARVSPTAVLLLPCQSDRRHTRHSPVFLRRCRAIVTVILFAQQRRPFRYLSFTPFVPSSPPSNGLSRRYYHRVILQPAIERVPSPYPPSVPPFFPTHKSRRSSSSVRGRGSRFSLTGRDRRIM